MYFFEPLFDPTTQDLNNDGLILTFKSNNPSYSYAELNKDKTVKRTAEKEVISENAAVGVYTGGTKLFCNPYTKNVWNKAYCPLRRPLWVGS